MGQIVTYGVGGYCVDCHESHPHPLNNLIEVIEVPDEEDEHAVSDN